jgi:hypothetical protein
MQGIRGGDENIRARSTGLSKRHVIALALCLGLTAGLMLSLAAGAHVGPEYLVPTGSSYPQGITSGPDGALWFTEYSGNKIGSLKEETQRITGNPAESMAITAPEDNTGMVFTVGNNADEDRDDDNLVNCKSNITYTVKINCDVTGNKTSTFMWEWNGSAYVASGKKLQQAMEMKEHTGGTYTAIIETATTISGFTRKPPTSDTGTDTYVDYRQPIGYGDLPLRSNSYSQLLTYTIVNSV